jgi:amino acid transporter
MLYMFFCVLQNPQKDIPKGTILAILISSVVYIFVTWILGATVIRELPLTVCETFVVNNSVSSNTSIVHSLASNLTSSVVNCTIDTKKMFGLLHDFQVRKFGILRR